MATQKIVFHICPVGKGRPRFTRTGHTYTPQKTRDAEFLISNTARFEWRGEPLECPVSVKMTFYMPIPTSVPKKRLVELESGDAPHVGRPDTDNLAKLVLDSLNGIVWHDDSQIWNLYACKLYGKEPRIEMEIIY